MTRVMEREQRPGPTPQRTPRQVYSWNSFSAQRGSVWPVMRPDDRDSAELAHIARALQDDSVERIPHLTFGSVTRVNRCHQRAPRLTADDLLVEPVASISGSARARATIRERHERRREHTSPATRR